MSKILGMGNALVDVMTILKSDQTLEDFSLPKGSMQLVSKEFSNRLLAGTLGLQKKQSSGGSAANTINGLANLGLKTGFIGKIGKDDLGSFFEKDLEENRIKPTMFLDLEETGRSIALISKDSERTMATYLGAAVDLDEEDITSDIFQDYDYFHIEGYLVQNEALIRKSMRLAKSHGLTISIDMASYNIVMDYRDLFESLIDEYVDIILANESEAEALTGLKSEKALDRMSDMASYAIVKLGINGSLVKSGSEEYRIGIQKVKNIDSTGAGDLYGAGFLYGLSSELSIKTCGEIGSILGGYVTEVIGAKLDEARWELIREKVSELSQG
jgi:sugar/nucleoside kinase (ribokinase family)